MRWGRPGCRCRKLSEKRASALIHLQPCPQRWFGGRQRDGEFAWPQRLRCDANRRIGRAPDVWGVQKKRNWWRGIPRLPQIPADHELARPKLLQLIPKSSVLIRETALRPDVGRQAACSQGAAVQVGEPPADVTGDGFAAVVGDVDFDQTGGPISQRPRPGGARRTCAPCSAGPSIARDSQWRPSWPPASSR